MPETPTTLTITQRGALSRLLHTYGPTTIACAAAVKTLTDDSESAAVRKEAYDLIRELDRAGVVRYNPVTEMVQLLPPRAQPAGSAASAPNSTARPQEPEPLTLAEFIAKLQLRRARAVWEILLLYREQGGSLLPPRLAERIILRLHHRYHGTDADFLLASTKQVRHLIFSLRDYGFLQSTDTQGVYYITPAGLAQAAAVENFVRQYAPASASNAPEQTSAPK